METVGYLIFGVVAWFAARSKSAQAAIDPSAPRTGDVPADTVTLDLPTITARSRDVDILARTLWGEARGEGYDGMVAVADVILNRVAKAQRELGGKFWWGSDIASVCLKQSITGVNQFSCWNPRDVNRNQLLMVGPDDPQFSQALEIASRAVLGDLPDLTNGATHYFATSIAPPSWAAGATVTAQIGNHVFLIA